MTESIFSRGETRDRAARFVVKPRIGLDSRREDLLREADDEHVTKLLATDLAGVADPDRAAGDGRRMSEFAERSEESALNFAKTHGAHRAHRLQGSEDLQDTFRRMKAARRERAKRVEPVGPRAAFGQRRELIQDRQREGAERLEVPHLIFQGLGACALCVDARALELKRTKQPTETTLPSLARADHRSVDEKVFEATRHSKGAVVGKGALGDGSLQRLHRVGPLRLELSVEVLVARDEDILGRRRCAADRLRDHAKGEVLGKSARRKIARRAVEERQERAAAGVWAGRAAPEGKGNLRAAKSLAEVRTIASGGMHNDGHGIEGDALSREVSDAARDLQALAAFTGRGEEVDALVAEFVGLTRARKEMRATAAETRFGGLARLWVQGEGRENLRVTGHFGHENARRAAGEHLDEMRFAEGLYADVEEDAWRQGRLRRFGCEGEQTSPVEQLML